MTVRQFIEEKSLRVKFVILMSFSLAVSIVVLLASQYSVNRFVLHSMAEDNRQLIERFTERKNNSTRAQFNEHLASYVDLSSIVLAENLYNLDREGVQQILRGLVHHPGIVAIRVYDTVSESIFSEVYRDGDVIFSHIPGGPLQLVADLQQVEKAIYFRSTQVGVVLLYYDTRFLRLQVEEDASFLENLHQSSIDITRGYLHSSWLFFILLSAGIIFLFSWNAYALIRLLVLKPLTALQDEMELVASEEKKFIEKRGGIHNDEIGRLRLYFNNHIGKMVSLLRKELHYDRLTGLHSRTRLISDLTDSGQIQLAVLDIDNFRDFNNFFGYANGDRILCFFAETLQRFFTMEHCALYRMNGDEFAVIMRHVTPGEFQGLIADFLSHCEDQAFTLEETRCTLTVSAGLAGGTERLFVCALSALVHARNTKQQLVVYNENLPVLKNHECNIRMTTLIRDAIRQQQVVPVFQPICSLESGQVVAYEALMRIRSEDGRYHLPGSFLGVAIKSRQYPAMSRRIIEQSCLQFRDQECSLSINLSLQDIEELNILNFITHRINSFGMQDRIVFEITEQEGVRNYDLVRSFCQEAKAMGYRIAIDDFGAGYSSLEHIIQLNADILKIDGSLIRNIDKDPNKEVLVATIVSFANKLGMKTTAEYIESAEVLAKVRELGVCCGQGYYLGRPGALPPLVIRPGGTGWEGKGGYSPSV